MPGLPEIGNGKILFNVHMGRSTLQRVLEQMTDHFTAAIFPQERDVLTVQLNGALIYIEITGNCAKHGGFACAVGADNGGKLSGIQMQAQIVQCGLLVDGTGVKGLGNIGQCQHFAPPRRAAFCF